MTSAYTDSKIIITTDPATLRRLAEQMEARYARVRVGETTFVDFLGHLKDGTPICVHFDQQAMDAQTEKRAAEMNVNEGMAQDRIRNLILTNVPGTPVDHNTLWRMCGSPQGQDSYYFDVQLGKLTEERKIRRDSNLSGHLVYGRMT